MVIWYVEGGLWKAGLKPWGLKQIRGLYSMLGATVSRLSLCVMTQLSQPLVLHTEKIFVKTHEYVLELLEDNCTYKFTGSHTSSHNWAWYNEVLCWYAEAKSYRTFNGRSPELLEQHNKDQITLEPDKSKLVYLKWKFVVAWLVLAQSKIDESAKHSRGWPYFKGINVLLRGRTNGANNPEYNRWCLYCN